MSTAVATIEPKRSMIADMALRYNMEPKAFSDTLRGTVVPKNATNEEFAAFLMVAREYNLNPITKEIFAFPKQGGGIQPIVSVDGWANLINSHPQCDGVEFADDLNDKGELVSITCKIFRKDRSHPTCATEYMTECKRDTSTWKQWPRRMLRHKALIQAARYAFGFAGVVDQDEAERFVDTGPVLSPPPAPPPTPQAKAHILETVGEPVPSALSLDVEWTNYFEMQKAELTNAKTAHERQMVSETVHDSINGAVERAELTEAKADLLREKWDEIAA
jgi:phage recombination protein Bet